MSRFKIMRLPVTLSILFVLFLGIVVPDSSFSQSLSVASKKKVDPFRQAEKVLRTKSVFTPAEVAKIQPAVTAVVGNKASLDQCQKLLGSIEKKIETDKIAISSISSNLQALAESPYAKKIKTMRGSDLKACRESIGGLVQQIVATAIEVPTIYGNFKDQEACVVKVEKGFALLADPGLKYSFPSAWAVIAHNVQGPYVAWGQHYQELLKERPELKAGAVDLPRRDLKNDKKEFMYFFEKLQRKLRLLVPAGSGDF